MSEEKKLYDSGDLQNHLNLQAKLYVQRYKEVVGQLKNEDEKAVILSNIDVIPEIIGIHMKIYLTDYGSDIIGNDGKVDFEHFLESIDNQLESSLDDVLKGAEEDFGDEFDKDKTEKSYNQISNGVKKILSEVERNIDKGGKGSSPTEVWSR